MERKWINPPLVNPSLGIHIIRITLAILVGIHGMHGLLHPPSIDGFGQYLASLGFPQGTALAWIICIFQVGAGVLLIINRLVIIACILDILILATGIYLIHMHEGWFVVGPGKDGVEYSLALIAGLVAVLLAYWPKNNAV
jgi:putative oxidoreductase